MNIRLRCLLLDDELTGLAYLRMLCEQIPELEIVKAFNNPEVLIRELPQLEFDLCIMDIEMPQLSGVEIVPLLGGKPVIFVTAHKEYAADAFDLDVVDFVQKPIHSGRLHKAVDKVMTRNSLPAVHKGIKLLELYTDKGLSHIDTNQILYLRASSVDSRDKEMYMKNGMRLLLKNISYQKLEGLLSKEYFCRINKREIINIEIVEHITGTQIVSNIETDKDEPLVFSLTDIYRNSFYERIRINF